MNTFALHFAPYVKLRSLSFSSCIQFYSTRSCYIFRSHFTHLAGGQYFGISSNFSLLILAKRNELKFFTPLIHLHCIQPSPQAFSARSILDSILSCDVTERYTPRTSSQYCQIKYGGLFVRLLQLQPKVAENPSFEQEEFLCACHSEKQSFGFLKKDSRDQILFNLSGLSRAATDTR